MHDDTCQDDMSKVTMEERDDVTLAASMVKFGQIVLQAEIIDDDDDDDDEKNNQPESYQMSRVSFVSTNITCHETIWTIKHCWMLGSGCGPEVVVYIEMPYCTHFIDSNQALPCTSEQKFRNLVSWRSLCAWWCMMMYYCTTFWNKNRIKATNSW